MSFSARYVPVVVLTLFSLAATVCAQSPTRQTTKTPRGSVSGRVTIKDKGAPGVSIGLRRENVPAPFESFVKATTDQDGFYRVGNLAPGSYEVTPSAPAYVIEGAANLQNSSKMVLIAEDENVDGINFSLVRGGVITGKVTDADGRPLILQQVFLFRSDQFQTQPQHQGASRSVFATTATVTDDRGIYRMYGLPSGSYKVACGRAPDTFVQSFPPSRTTYSRVFHPDATDESRATVINVTEGSEANNVDIAMGRPQSTFSASGKVIDSEKGMPVPNLRFGLQRSVGPRFDMVPMQIMSNARGDFVIEGLVPGKYGIYLHQGAMQNPYPDMRAEALMFDIVDEDVTGLTVRLIKGASLSGVVVLESDNKAAIQKFQQLQLRAFVMPSQGLSGFGQSSSSAIGPDGSFRLGGLPAGIANIFLSPQAGLIDIRGFAITRVEREGVVAPPRGIEVKDGEQVTGVRVTVSYGTASIRGVVKIENGTLLPESQIFVRLIKPGENALSNLQPRVDSRGHFLIEGIPAGVYELHVTVPGGPTGRRVKQQTVTVQDGIVTDVVVTIDLSTTPKQ